MGIFNKVYSKIDVFVEFENAIILEIKGQIKKTNFDSFYLDHKDHIYVLTILNNCYDHHFCCQNKCEDVHYSFNFIFLNPICEKKERNNTLLIFIYVER